jgi:peptide deformylase
MLETMRNAQGVGLAANQVGQLWRVVVIEIPPDEEEGVEAQLFRLVNPQIVRRVGTREVEEGCLSVPGYRGLIQRSVRVTAKALDPQGRELRIKATDLLAQALEHEIDHLNGILYLDHLESHEKLWKLEPAATVSGAA